MHAGTRVRDTRFDVKASLEGNLLIGALRESDRLALSAWLTPVLLTAGRTLIHPGDDVEHAYFPCGEAMVALLVLAADGDVVEAATVGREGAIGGIVSLGHKPAFAQSTVQIGGHALRISSERLEMVKGESPTLRDALARYADCLLAQVLQSVACNALHTTEARFCRWLLTAQDRVGSEEVPLTQEFLAEMLGVQRTTVTGVATALQNRGLINYRRGRIRVLDRGGLESAACGCYEAVRAHFDRVLPGTYPRLGALP
jgi:CRP-like cAMP-binding protein